MSKQLRWYNPACFRVLPSRFTFRFLLWWNAAVVLCKMTPRFTFRLVIFDQSCTQLWMQTRACHIACCVCVRC